MYLQEGIYLQTGSISGNANLGQNKIITNSNGISLRRGGISAGDNVVTVGEIGATNTSDSHLYINGNATNNILVNSGIGSISLQSNTVWVGSSTAAANGRKSNIIMCDSSSNWETQSSAFTETLKTQLTSASTNYTTINSKFTDVASFWSNTGKYKTYVSTNALIGLSDPLPSNSSYSNIASGTPTYFNVGLYLYSNGLSSIFGNTGRFMLSTPMRFNISIEIDFDSCLGGEPTGGTTGVGIKILESRIRINNAGTEIDGTMWSGLHLSGYISSNKNVRYRLTINCIMYYGYEIIFQTYYDFNTGISSYTGAKLSATFILERQVL